MPELPEVEAAARIARAIAVGRSITRVLVRHRAQRQGLPARAARSLSGDQVLAVERRGKEQRFRLASGRELRVHFRMTGDWLVPAAGASLPRSVRAVLEFDDGGRLALDDPRALSVLSLCEAGAEDGELGIEATDPALTAAHLRSVLVRRSIPIKVALLDQRVVAGIGNIYASEALWRARLDPRLPANRLDRRQLGRLTTAVRETMADAFEKAGRYYAAGAVPDEGRFKVYDREGEPCLRCGSRIRRATQAGRSTYYCQKCVKR